MKMRPPDGVRVLFDEGCAGVKSVNFLLEVARGPRSKIVWQKVTLTRLQGFGVRSNKYHEIILLAHDEVWNHSKRSFAGKEAFMMPYFADASINGWSSSAFTRSG